MNELGTPPFHGIHQSAVIPSESAETGAQKMGLLPLAVAAPVRVAFELWPAMLPRKERGLHQKRRIARKSALRQGEGEVPAFVPKRLRTRGTRAAPIFSRALEEWEKVRGHAKPSQAVDELWHEFILHTKSYERFCRKAFGQFLHHTPAVVLTSNRQKNTGLRRCWWFACKEENTNPKSAARLPLLFALNGKLNIADGFRYVPDCKGVRRQDAAGGSSVTAYCGAEFSSTAYDGGTDGSTDGGGGGGGSSASGGGDGCGGGGCGGGGDRVLVEPCRHCTNPHWSCSPAWTELATYSSPFWR
ncbi:MAG: hypothetical protein R3E56_01155 [Burkholderiaceae bacterium]